jgi:hypothetical protein
MTAIARRLAICTLALGTVALAACSGDPVSPKAHSAASFEVYAGSSSRIDTATTPPTP